MTTEKIALEFSLPMDLAFEILLRLPSKSVLRFKSVSKSWCSIIRSKEFIEAFMSLSRPRHVLLLNNFFEDQVLFFSSPHQSCSSSMSFAKDNTLNMPKFKFYTNYICNSVRGFLCCTIEDGFAVCNLSTGQVIPLPKENDGDYSVIYLGYDPNSSQYKALRLIKPLMVYNSPIQHSVLTLGGQGSDHSWRPIKANNPDCWCYPNGVCIDGVVYYKSVKIDNQDKKMLSCFDVGSEQLLRDIVTPKTKNLSGDIANYLGKLAMHCYTGDGFNLWVLDDVKNQVWSKKIYKFPLLNEISTMRSRFRFEGITESGEIVYAPKWFSDSLELLCCNMEKKMGRRVRVTAVSDYINCSTLENSTTFYSSLLCSYVENIIYL